MSRDSIDINAYNYELPDERIAKFPLPSRSDSKLLIYRNGEISQGHFREIGGQLPQGAMLVFNNTKVIRARLIMHKESGARIEVFCLEPHAPADYERAFATQGECEWSCIVGNLKRWKQGEVFIDFDFEGTTHRLAAQITERGSHEHIVRFRWSLPLSFGQLLEHLGRIPIPPYLNRESEQIDYTRYQTVYSKFEGSVAAPTAGLHFTPELIESLRGNDINFEEVTLHVGAGTFLPVKEEDATQHPMHTEHFEVSLSSLRNMALNYGAIVAVGTTSVRTLESLAALAWRIEESGDADLQRVVGQWELYDIPSDFDGQRALVMLVKYLEDNGLSSLKASTQIMITPLGYRFRIVKYIITNFHQPKSTLLLLVSAYVGEDWHYIYSYALDNDFRFLSYGDSSLLIVD
ncbi:MAG: S-adenosylmethionine:tRNA ribosyltransferase-isomerase [Rikenellaceae bacterium]